MDKDDYQKWLDMVKTEVDKDVSKDITGNKFIKTEIKNENDLKTDENDTKLDVKIELKREEPVDIKDNLKTEVEVEEKKSDPLLDDFFAEINDIKSEAFRTTSKEQLDRLLRPGSTYFNLNPFEVLQVDPYCSVEEIRKKYRKIAIYVHPDKNPNDKERADIAFEAVNRAHKMLDDDKERKKCLEVVEEAKERVDKTIEEKRRKVRREAVAAAALLSEKSKSSKSSHKISKEPEQKPVSTAIEEDDPDKYRYAIYSMTCKLFADIERLKVRERERNAEDKKRKADEKASDEVSSKKSKEWNKNYEESRQNRVSSWQNFARKPPGEPTTTKVKTAVPKSKPALFFRPPKHKPESR